MEQQSRRAKEYGGFSFKERPTRAMIACDGHVEILAKRAGPWLLRKAAGGA